MPEKPRAPRRREDVKLTVLGRVESKSETVLLDKTQSERVIRKAVSDAIERALPLLMKRLLERAAPIVTAAQLAHMLGVSARTITERYVRDGMPCVRLSGKRQPPVFVLEDVVVWLRERAG